MQLWLSSGFKINFKLICCTYPNILMTFANILGFFLNFLTSWKSCVKKKSLFNNFDFTSRFEAPKRGKFILVPQILINDQVHKEQTMLNMLTVFGEQIMGVSSWKTKLYFWNRLTQKIVFFVVSWHKQPPSDIIVKFWPQVSQQFWKLWLTHFFYPV